MAEGKDSKSTYRTGEADKRLAEYKQAIEKALKRYGSSRTKFVSKLAQFILAEVGNERKMMQEFVDKLECVYEEFTKEET